ncbi:unnamed protein product [Penicillium pancosmium]
MRGRWRGSGVTSVSRNDIASRLTRLERELTSMRTPESQGMKAPGKNHADAGRLQRQEDVLRFIEGGELAFSNRSPSPDVQAFSGETSIAHNLTVVEGRLEQMGVQYSRERSTSPNGQYRSNLTPSPDSESSLQHFQEQGTSLTQRVLRKHGIIPDRDQWEAIMHTFCDEVHVLVPFLHLPVVWRLYEQTWAISFGQNSNRSSQSESQRFQTAHILLCLANGKCVESSRFEGDQGPYSAGWSFYNAARDVFGDLLDGFSQCTDQIFLLQTVVLMVIYLFRLDAHGPAEKVLALSISHAHHLGIQRKRMVDAMTPFEGEMARRLWWCIYLLDRRLAIETGRPFLIQDVNVDVGLPHNISDERLEKYRKTLTPVVSDEEVIEGPTMVPYLIAMASYSRVIGKVWEALYGAATSDKTPTTLLNEYLEHLILQSQKCISHEFSYDPLSPSNYDSKALAWWQVKQQFMMRIRWSSIHLLIRKPMLQRLMPIDEPELIQNEVTCMRLAQRIIDDFKKVPEEHPKYTFPFLHYLTSATIIALGLIIKQPSFKGAYGDLTLEATVSLREHCRKTWMSGKMIRTVGKLKQMADAILSPDHQSSENPRALEVLPGSSSSNLNNNYRNNHANEFGRQTISALTS